MDAYDAFVLFLVFKCESEVCFVFCLGYCWGVVAVFAGVGSVARFCNL